MNTGYIPNCIEAIEAMLAASSIGAIWSSTSPEFGVSVSVYLDFVNVLHSPKLKLCELYYAFPTGSVYGCGKQRRRWTLMGSESASNLNKLCIVNKAGLFHILFGLIKL